MSTKPPITYADVTFLLSITLDPSEHGEEEEKALFDLAARLAKWLPKPAPLPLDQVPESLRHHLKPPSDGR